MRTINAKKLQMLCVMVICTWMVSPPLAYSSAFRLAAFSCFSLWCFLELFKPDGIFRKPTLPVLLLFIFLLFNILTEVMTRGGMGVVSNIQLYLMLFFILVQQSSRKSIAELSSVFWFVVVVLSFWMTLSLVHVISIDPHAMRKVVRSDGDAKMLMKVGVGGYAMVYGAVVMLPMLLYLSIRPGLVRFIGAPYIIKVVPRGPYFLIAYFTIVSLLIIVYSQYSIAFMVASISVVFILIYSRLSPVALFMCLLMVMFMAVYGKELVYQLLLFMRDLTHSPNYILKINDLISTLEGGAVIGTLDNRVGLYGMSFEAFIESPIFGNISDDRALGGHSLLLDEFARRGMFWGGVLVYLLLFGLLRSASASYRFLSKSSVFIVAIFSVLMVLGVNNEFGFLGFVVYIMYPYLFGALAEQEREIRSF